MKRFQAKREKPQILHVGMWEEVLLTTSLKIPQKKILKSEYLAQNTVDH